MDRAEFRYKSAREILKMLAQLLKIPDEQIDRLDIKFQVSHRTREQFDFYKNVGDFKKRAILVVGTSRPPFTPQRACSYSAGRVA